MRWTSMISWRQIKEMTLDNVGGSHPISERPWEQKQFSQSKGNSVSRLSRRNPEFPACPTDLGPTSSYSLAWKIPWMEKPGRLQSMGSLRVRHDCVTSLSLFTFMHWRRKWQPTPVFLPENPRDGRAWWAAVYGVAQSRTWLKWLSSSSSYNHRSQFLEITQVALLVKNPLTNASEARNTSFIPESGRSPRVGNSNPLQYSCLGNPMDREEPGGLQSTGSQRDMTEHVHTHTHTHTHTHILLVLSVSLESLTHTVPLSDQRSFPIPAILLRH